MATRYSCRECDYSFVLSDKGFRTADVKTHCNKIMHTEEVSEQGPKLPLEEKDARIDQLQNMLASLARYVRVNVLSQRNDPYLLTIVEQAEWTAKGEKTSMSELKPLDIVDNRTPEQVRADGDERWPDGRPYIKDGVCCVCGVNVAQEAEKYPVHVCLLKFDIPQACGIHLKETGEWTGPAYWLLGLDSACDKCIVDMLEKLPDNRAWLEPALTDIRARHLKIGARVRIQVPGELAGHLGTVYNHLPSRPCPWHVHPDGWSEYCAGVAYLAEELDVIL